MFKKDTMVFKKQLDQYVSYDLPIIFFFPQKPQTDENIWEHLWSTFFPVSRLCHVKREHALPVKSIIINEM